MKQFKVLLITALVALNLFVVYDYHFILRKDIVVSHFFYIPVILSSFWWKRKGIWIAFLLSGCLIFFHFLSTEKLNYITPDLIRSSMLITVSITTALLSEKRAAAENKIVEFSRKILAVREEEKKRTAIDLHDELGAMTIAINSNLDILEEEIKNSDPENAEKYLIKMRTIVKNSVRKLKQISVDLRPPDLNMVGLNETIKQYCTAIGHDLKLDIKLDIDLKEENVQEDVSITIFRVVQETLNNIIKHSGAKEVKIRISGTNESLKLEISDNGCGFEPDTLYQSGRNMKIGIEGMRQRIESLGGAFTLKSKKGNGCTIYATIPNVSIPKQIQPI